MKLPKNISSRTLLPIILLLAVVLVFNFFMWHNYQKIQDNLAQFGDRSYFAGESNREETAREGRAEEPESLRITAAGRSGSGQTGDFQEEGLRLALIASGSEAERKLLREGAEQAAGSLGVELKFYHADPGGQLSPTDYLELTALADFDGAMVEGTSARLADRINAVADELAVVTVNSDFPDSSRLSYVGLDHHQAGYQIGRYLLENIDGAGGRVVLLSSRVEEEQALSSSEQLKIFGFQEALAASGQRELLLHKEVSPDLLEISREISGIFSEHEVAAIFSLSENITLLLEESAVLSSRDEDIFKIGYGSRASLADELEEMNFDALIYRDSSQVGSQAVREMTTILTRGSVNLHTRVEMELITELQNYQGVTADEPGD